MNYLGIYGMDAHNRSRQNRFAGLAHHLQSVLTDIELTPFWVTFVYVIFGLGALYLSDVLFVHWFSEPLLSRVQAFKGIVEVGLTAGIIYVLMRGSQYPMQHETEMLRRQREELQVLHRVLRHNLRNDLNVIMGYVDLLQHNPSSPSAEEWCRNILNGVEGLLDYTNKATQIEEISDPRNGRFSEYNLVEGIPSVVRHHDLITDDVEVAVDLPETAPVEANHMLEPAIDELVTNAIQHNDSEMPRVSITVDPTRGPVGTTQIVIEDNGPGIDDDTLTVLEEAREDSLMHMSGLGLWMVYWTVMESNGHLNIYSGDDGGTRVELTLPKSLDLSPKSIAAAVSGAE